MQKTLLVGLDSACWEYINPLLEEGRMPVLQALLDKGASGTLTSTMPPWTPAAWSSIITGKNPGKHGVFDMLWRQPGTYQFTPANANVRLGTPFWKRLNEHGIRVGLVNVPFTYPPQPIDGFLLCGFGTPDSSSDIAYPPDIKTWIRHNYPEFRPIVESHFLETATPQEILVKEIEHQSQQVEIALELSKQYPVDVLVINLMLTDHANHKMPDLLQVQEAYCQTDIDLGRLVDNFQPDHVMLISDHGSNRVKGDFLLYTWLQDHGYLSLHRNELSERRSRLNWVLIQWLQVYHQMSGLPEKALRGLLRRALLRIPSKWTERFLSGLDRLIPMARAHVFLGDQPDYNTTSVFPGSVYSGLLYANLAGREPKGVLSHQSREKVITELKAKLYHIKDPDTGQPLFSNVYSAGDIYPGEVVTGAPDLILDSYLNGWNIRLSNLIPRPGTIRDEYFVDANAVNRRDYGWHTREGIFIFTGQFFEPGQSAFSADLMDIPATLLYLYTVPIPDDYDGRVLTGMFTPEYANRTVDYQPGDVVDHISPGETFTKEEADEFADHLRALGYLN